MLFSASEYGKYEKPVSKKKFLTIVFQGNRPYSKMATMLIFFFWYLNKPVLPRS